MAKHLTNDLAKTVSLSTVGFLWTHWALPSLLVVGSPLVVGVSAYFANVQWRLVFLCALLAFASAAVGVYFADLEISRRVLKGKLLFESLLLVKSIKNIEGSEFCIGFRFKNTSDFPVQFDVRHLKTNVGDFFPAKKDFKKTVFDIDPNGIGAFIDYEIDFKEIPKEKTLQGYAEILIYYGRPDKLRHELISKKDFFIVLGKDSEVKAFNWQDASNS